MGKKLVTVQLLLDENEQIEWQKIKEQYRLPSFWLREVLSNKVDISNIKNDLQYNISQMQKGLEEVKEKYDSILQQLNTILTFLTYQTSK
jgi:hypothetical protein